MILLPPVGCLETAMFNSDQPRREGNTFLVKPWKHTVSLKPFLALPWNHQDCTMCTPSPPELSMHDLISVFYIRMVLLLVIKVTQITSEKWCERSWAEGKPSFLYQSWNGNATGIRSVDFDTFLTGGKSRDRLFTTMINKPFFSFILVSISLEGVSLVGSNPSKHQTGFVDRGLTWVFISYCVPSCFCTSICFRGLHLRGCKSLPRPLQGHRPTANRPPKTTVIERVR